VNAWGEGVKSPQEVDRLVETAKVAGVNALFVQVRKRADAYYRSDLVPCARDVPAGYDPLEDLLAKAHAEGIQVHAWMVMLLAQSALSGRAIPPDSLLAQHPDWVTFSKAGRRMGPGQSEGYYLDPGVPEVRQYLASVVRDLVERYPVDGVNLDYIRYPGAKWGYHPTAVWRFHRETGKATLRAPQLWSQWRRNQVTNLVRAITAAAKLARPGVQVSADVWANVPEARENRLQDWERWLKLGALDFVLPMNYTSNLALFRRRAADLYRRNGTAKVCMGIYNVPQAVEMAREALKLGGQGIAFYHYGGFQPPFWENLKARVADGGS
jgi:uncharacterized lipoprotein YddW (UPF0748 family)